MIIVNSYYYNIFTFILDSLNSYAKKGGALIYAAWDLEDYSDHEFVTSILGVQYLQTIFTPINFHSTNSGHPIFNRPNTVSELYWSDNQLDRDGQIAEPQGGFQAISAFEGYPASGSIIINSKNKIIYNGFQAVNYNRDDDFDGKLDIIELIENEISFLAESSGWLKPSVSGGTVSNGSSENVNIKFDANGLSAGDYLAQITLNNNDPVNPRVDISAHLHVKPNTPVVIKYIDTIHLDITDATYHVMLDSLFSSPSGDKLTYTQILSNTHRNIAWVEIIDNMLNIDPVSTGKGLLTITADNNAGGTTVNMSIVLIIDRQTSVSDITGSGFYLNNYPNPFDGITNICYNLDKRAYIEVRIYSLQGQLLNTLVNAYENEGEKIMKFNASLYNPGVYIYELRIDGRTSGRNRMIIK
jgi:hypothetical protein